MVKKIARKELKKIRRWDLSTAKRVDRFIANSNETARRIREIYGREATVIHPPVDKRFFANDGQGNANASDFLAVGRLVPYKRFDLLIDVANAHRFPLTIVGRGSDAARLKKLAGSTVTFRGHVSDEELVRLYRNAKALLLPQLEDAGIVPREAQAAGTPVIAFAEGGALDVIVNGVTGVLFSQQTKESLEEALRAFKGMTFDHAAIQEHARKFSSEGFRDAVLALVEDVRQKASASRTATTTYRSPVILNA
jgi:glycosyltransferase involved in cell wall biosynthesis